MKDFSQPNPPPKIPDHQLIRRIGEGAYGEIWLAKNVIGGYRAVKIVYRANFKDVWPYEREFKGIQRFEPISRSHPGLVDVLQIGRNDEAAYFYYIMELADDEMADGKFDAETYAPKTLSRIQARGRLAAAECLEIGCGLAAALAHMHREGLVHRDVKPSNIIFVDGKPKLADIGLVAAVTEVTRKDVGTEGYTPGEGPGTVEADLYSLGKVLYEISTGQDRTMFPALPAELSEFPDADLVVELNEVVVKACANSPAARYARAEDLRLDLERILAGRSIKRLRFMERRLARAKRWAIAATALALVAMVFGLVVNHLRAREKKLLARAYVTDGVQMMESGRLHGALPLFSAALNLERKDKDAAETHRLRLGSLLQQSPRLLQFWHTESGLNDIQFRPDNRHLLMVSGRCARVIDLETTATVMEFQTKHMIERAAFSHDGTKMVLPNGKSVIVVDIASGTSAEFLPRQDVLSAEFSPDDTKIVVGCWGTNAYVIDLQTGEWRSNALGGHHGAARYAAFSPDGSMIATADDRGIVFLWDTATRTQIARMPQGNVWTYDIAFSPDGRHFVTAASDRMVRLWNLNGSAVPARMEHHAEVRRVRFSPDGQWVISASFDHTVRFWDAHTGQPVGGTLELDTAAMGAAFDPESRRVATGSRSGEIKIWEMTSAAPLNVGQAAVSENGERYVTYSSNAFRIWNARNDLPLTLLVEAGGIIRTVLCSRTGERFLLQLKTTNDEMQVAQFIDANGTTVSRFEVPGSGSRWWLNADGTRLLASTLNDIYLWDTVAAKLIFDPITLAARARIAGFSSDGKWMAIAVQTNVLVLDASSGNKVLELGHDTTVSALSFSENSERLVTATAPKGFDAGAAYIWNVPAGTRVGRSMPHSDGVSDVRFSFDGTLVATSSEDQRAMVWSARTGEPIAEPISRPAQVLAIRFSPDDKWIITTTWYEAQVWNARTGQAVTPPFSHAAILEQSGICAGGERLWVQSRRGLLFWNLPRATGEPDEWIALADHLGAQIPLTLRWNPDAFPLKRLREECEAARLRMNTNAAAWHLQQAQLGEIKEDWFTAQFHFGWLLKTKPTDPALLKRLNNARTRLAPAPGTAAEELSR